MESIKEDDEISVRTSPRDPDDVENVLSDDGGEDDEDWEKIEQRLTPEPSVIKVGSVDPEMHDVMTESHFASDDDRGDLDEPPSSTEHGSLPKESYSEAMFQDDDSEEESCADAKPIGSMEEDEISVPRNGRRIGVTVNESEDEGVHQEDIQSPVVHEDYLKHHSALFDDLKLDETYDEDATRYASNDEIQMSEVISLLEILQSGPPLSQSASIASPNRDRGDSSAIPSVVPVTNVTDCDKMEHLPLWSNFAVGLVILLVLWGVSSLWVFIDRPTGCRLSLHLRNESRDDIDIPASFISAFMREVSSCDGTCCFSLFILTGDNSAHEQAVLSAMSKTERWRNSPRLESWSAQRLLDWTEGVTDGATTPTVVLVKNADDLDTRQVQRVIKYGQRLCRQRRQTRARSKIIVLSTSFGSEILNDPDEVLSDKFVEEFKQRDWLAVPEIVLNRHGIIHGIRGKRPRRVFEEYLQAHRRKGQAKRVGEHHQSWLFSSLSRLSFSRLFAGGYLTQQVETDSMVNSHKRLDAWLETKRTVLAWTQNARRVLANKLQDTGTPATMISWLENQYSLWTRNGSCESVLFRSSPTDVKSFNVNCGSASGRTTCQA